MVRTHEERTGLGKMGLLRLLLVCSCLPIVFLRIQSTSGSCRISLPIFVWLYENVQSTMHRWKLCQTNSRSPSSGVKMNAETYKPREPDGLVLWKQKGQSLGNFLQEQSDIHLHLVCHPCAGVTCTDMNGSFMGMIEGHWCQWEFFSLYFNGL